MDRQQVFGRRAVGELLDSGLEVIEIFFAVGGRGGIFDKLKVTAASGGVRVVSMSRAELDRMAPGENHQGIIAYYRQPDLLHVDELLDRAPKTESRPILLLDGIEDPRNLGAIIRSAEVMGAAGVVIKKHKAAGITPSMVKASAGAALWLPIALASSLDRAIRSMKERGYWIYGLDAGAEDSLWELEFDDHAVFVIGSEGRGLSRLVRERCDHLIRIPQLGKVASLNVAVSASIALAEWLRRSMRKR